MKARSLKKLLGLVIKENNMFLAASWVGWTESLQPFLVSQDVDKIQP